VLALTRRVNLPDVPHVEIYGDHQDDFTFFVVPTRPALELDDRERPTLRLLVYMKKDDAQRSSPSGGQVTMTTVLEVPAGELAQITQALKARTSQQGAGGVHLVNPDWASGTVTVTLGPTLKLTGQPALFAGNRCAFSSPLSADQARQIHDDGVRTLGASTIRYDMEMRVASTVTSSSRVTQSSRNTSFEADRAISLDARMTGMVNHAVTFEGPLWTGQLEHLITDIELS
jgi:hypothetical protein